MLYIFLIIFILIIYILTSTLLKDDNSLFTMLLLKVKHFIETGDLEKIESIVDKSITVLEGKSELMCYGPAIKKCQEENPGAECEKGKFVVRPKCKDGYEHSLGKCVVKCPEGFDDYGISCRKPKTSYGRGVGYAIWNEEKCNRENK